MTQKIIQEFQQLESDSNWTQNGPKMGLKMLLNC